MMTASTLPALRVRTTSGRLLGRAFDVRCVHRGSEARVTHLVYGRRGLLERLGFRRQRHDTIPWDRVIGIHDREFIVSD